MREIIVQKQFVNIEALAADLRAALGGVVSGISTGPNGVRIHIHDAASEAQLQQAFVIGQTHDATNLTDTQKAEAERQLRLEQARSDNTTPLDIAEYEADLPAVKLLARKIAWLEQEIANLRRT